MTFERCSALVVRYWSTNMTKIHDTGNSWPGFGYTDAEKAELKSMSQKVPMSEYYWFLFVVTVIAISFFAGIVVAGMTLLLGVIGGEQNMPNTPAALFFFSLALEAVASLTIGLPVAMLLGSAVVGACSGVRDSDLPNPAISAKYFHKLCFQITRMTLILVGVVLPFWILVPNDSKIMVFVRLIVPLMSPVVTALTMLYYFTGRAARTTVASR